MLLCAVIAAALVGTAAAALAEPENTHWPNYKEGDFIISDYKFANGQTLPQLKLHYRTLGFAERNVAGEITNGVLLLQGNTGTGANWLRPSLADELFKDGSRWMPGDTSSSCQIHSVAAARVNPRTGSKVISRTTAITTWSTACTGWSPRGSRVPICVS